MWVSRYRLRLLCVLGILSAGLLLDPFAGPSAAGRSSSAVAAMPMADLQRILSGSDGSCLLFFTAAWCGHCKTMLPVLNRLQHRFRKDAIRFIGISIDAGGPVAMERALENQPADFPVFWVGESVVDELRLVGIPIIFLVKNGRIVEKIPGKCSYAFLEGKIVDVIK